MTTAQIAIRAARNWNSWGRHAAVMYVVRRGVPVRLLALARFLESQSREGK